MSLKYPEFCQKMQIKITDILLQDIYITPDSCFQKAQTLVRKGKALRICGTGVLRDCIQCLSDAITIMVSFLVLLVSFSSILYCRYISHLYEAHPLQQKEICDEVGTNKNVIDHQLAVAYCVRALCTQEAEPSSKVLEHILIISTI